MTHQEAFPGARWHLALPRAGGESAVWLGLAFALPDATCWAWTPGSAPTVGEELVSEEVQTRFRMPTTGLGDKPSCGK